MKMLFKKMIAIQLCLTLFFSSGAMQVFAQEADTSSLSENTVPVNTSTLSSSAIESTKYSAELIAAYKQLCTYFTDNNIPASISLETFAQEYNTDIYSSLSDYLQKYFLLYQRPSSDSEKGSSEFWYFNTDGCTVMPDYTRYNLLSVVQPGDILYEAAGGSGITHHIAIVEGIYFDSYYKTFYIGLIEAIAYISGNGDADGVCRGVLDDDRFDQQQGVILRVSGASSTQITRAINFCKGELGSDYLLDGGKETDSSTQHWYCSELIWAAYYNQGIDLETPDTFPGITPDELLNSSKTVAQTVTSNLGAPTITSISIASQTKAIIYWSSISNASSYSVYRAVSSPTSNVTLLTTTTNTYYSDTTLSSNKTYYYWIVANLSGTTSSRSPIKAIQTAFTTTSTSWCYATSNTSIEFSWPQVYNAEKYEIYRSAGSSSNFIKITTVYTTTFTDSGLTSGTEYYYRVCPVSYSGNAATSTNYIRVTPGVMRRPKIYLVHNQEYISILLKWTKVPEATSYDVYYSVNDSGTYIKFTTTEKTYCHYLYPEYDGTWYFRVVPVNSQGEGQWSYSVSYTVDSGS